MIYLRFKRFGQETTEVLRDERLLPPDVYERVAEYLRGTCEEEDFGFCAEVQGRFPHERMLLDLTAVPVLLISMSKRGVGRGQEIVQQTRREARVRSDGALPVIFFCANGYAMRANAPYEEIISFPKGFDVNLAVPELLPDPDVWEDVG